MWLKARQAHFRPSPPFCRLYRSPRRGRIQAFIQPDRGIQRRVWAGGSVAAAAVRGQATRCVALLHSLACRSTHTSYLCSALTGKPFPLPYCCCAEPAHLWRSPCCAPWRLRHHPRPRPRPRHEHHSVSVQPKRRPLLPRRRQLLGTLPERCSVRRCPRRGLQRRHHDSLWGAERLWRSHRRPGRPGGGTACPCRCRRTRQPHSGVAPPSADGGSPE